VEYLTSGIFLIAILLQVAAGLIAFRLAHTSRARWPWLLISVAFACTAVIELNFLLDHHPGADAHSHGELLAFSSALVSVLVLIGFVFVYQNDKRIKEIEVSLKESEQKFRDFGETASDWFWETDSDFRFSNFSSRTKDIVGLDTTKMLGKSRFEITNEKMLQTKWKRHLDDLKNHRPFRDFEYTIKTDGQPAIPVSISGKPVFDDDGVFQGYRGTGRNITNQKRAEAALIAAKVAAETANEAKSEFLSSISHELRTPLNAIVGFTQVMQMRGPEGLSPVHVKALNQISDSAGNLSELIGQLLEMSKIEAGELDISMQSAVLHDIIMGALQAAKLRANETDITVIDQTKGTKLPMVRTDPLRLRQIIANLSINAVKYNRPGGHLIVSATVISSTTIRVAIEDNGLGIPHDQKEGVFQRFNRLGRDRSTIEGTGVGLSISKTLTELIDADIGFVSEEGVGSTFWVDIPIAQDPSSREPSEQNFLRAV
jgi:PAS domain S-box-containing protein